MSVTPALNLCTKTTLCPHCSAVLDIVGPYDKVHCYQCNQESYMPLESGQRFVETVCCKRLVLVTEKEPHLFCTQCNEWQFIDEVAPRKKIGGIWVAETCRAFESLRQLHGAKRRVEELTKELAASENKNKMMVDTVNDFVYSRDEFLVKKGHDISSRIADKGLNKRFPKEFKKIQKKKKELLMLCHQTQLIANPPTVNEKSHLDVSAEGNSSEKSQLSQ